MIPSKYYVATTYFACAYSQMFTSTYFHTASTSCMFAGAQQSCHVGLGVGIPVSILLTAIISSLLTLLITYLCMSRGRNQKSTPPVQEPVYDPVSSGTSVEMKSNMAYGQVTGRGHVTYETVAQ